jgi:hypothetical protein
MGRAAATRGTSDELTVLYSNGSGYTGHYIVLCGYDGARREFIVRDPASAVATLRVSEVGLEEARKSFGAAPRAYPNP